MVDEWLKAGEMTDLGENKQPYTEDAKRKMPDLHYLVEQYCLSRGEQTKALWKAVGRIVSNVALKEMSGYTRLLLDIADIGEKRMQELGENFLLEIMEALIKKGIFEQFYIEDYDSSLIGGSIKTLTRQHIWMQLRHKFPFYRNIGEVLNRGLESGEYVKFPRPRQDKDRGKRGWGLAARADEYRKSEPGDPQTGGFGYLLSCIGSLKGTTRKIKGKRTINNIMEALVAEILHRLADYGVLVSKFNLFRIIRSLIGDLDLEPLVLEARVRATDEDESRDYHDIVADERAIDMFEIRDLIEGVIAQFSSRQIGVYKCCSIDSMSLEAAGSALGCSKSTVGNERQEIEDLVDECVGGLSEPEETVFFAELDKRVLEIRPDPAY